MRLRKDSIFDHPYAFLFWGIGTLGAVVLAMLFFIFIPRCIDAFDSSIWYRYASSNKVSSMVFLQPCTETQGFIDNVRNIDGVAEAEEKGDSMGVYEAMYAHIDSVCELAINDSDYCNYLQSRGLTVEDLRVTLSRLTDLESVVFNVSFYLALLIYSIWVVGILKLRKVFYIMAGVIYVLFEASVFSAGLTDYLVTFVMNVWGKIVGSELTYADTFIFRDSFLNALKEAMLTIIIFDTVSQARDSRKQKEKEFEIEFFRESLRIQRAYLEENVSPNAIYIGRLFLPAKNIYRICRKQIKYWSNRLKRKHINSYYTSLYNSNLSLAQDFVDMIYQLEYNAEEHENTYYIDLIKSAELLFAEAYKREMFEV